jgi:hypothetical protein
VHFQINLPEKYILLENVLKLKILVKSRGLNEQAVIKNGYRVVNSFTTKKRVKTIITRISLQFSDKEWRSIVSALYEIILFRKYGF